MPAFEPVREPLRVTLTRTVGIALVAGAVLAHWWGRPAAWPVRWAVASAVMLWPAFGGHWLELWFLNWLRPRIGDRRGVQVGARLATWFIGGAGLALGMWLTALALASRRPPSRGAWWVGGVAFMGLELVAQLALQLRGRPSFFNGRG